MRQAGADLNRVDDRQAERSGKVEVKIAVPAGRYIPKYAHIGSICPRIRDDVELPQEWAAVELDIKYTAVLSST